MLIAIKEMASYRDEMTKKCHLETANYLEAWKQGFGYFKDSPLRHCSTFTAFPAFSSSISSVVTMYSFSDIALSCSGCIETTKILLWTT